MHESTTALAPTANAQSHARDLYFGLNAGVPDRREREAARQFVDGQLRAAAAIASSLPADPGDLFSWMRDGTDEVGASYAEYLRARRHGEPRRYFPAKVHALAFLQSVAPTKLVDGAWLFGTLERWEDPAFRPLITTYLEELGSGVPTKNHVAIYQRLLASNGCENWRLLPDRNFVQGAIQLSLGWNASHFLPELIGFNLGYEQLPLHLLITAYELNELGIDPYYFVLHVTVDNAATGHAVKAIQALHGLMARAGDRAEFYRRAQNGFRLNELGAGTSDVIASFDLETELTRVLVQKSSVGKNMHSDFCRVAGRTVNDWLSQPEQIPEFLAQLAAAGWIQRGVAAEQSRFWRLIHGDNAEMFGVFTAYEQELLRFWIEHPRHGLGTAAPAARPVTHRAMRRRSEGIFPGAAPARQHGARPLLRGLGEPDGPAPGFDPELRLLECRLETMATRQQAMHHLRALMSPTSHHTPAGLMATRIFQRMLD